MRRLVPIPAGHINTPEMWRRLANKRGTRFARSKRPTDRGGVSVKKPLRSRSLSCSPLSLWFFVQEWPDWAGPRPPRASKEHGAITPQSVPWPRRFDPLCRYTRTPSPSSKPSACFLPYGRLESSAEKPRYAHRRDSFPYRSAPVGPSGLRMTSAPQRSLLTLLSWTLLFFGTYLRKLTMSIMAGCAGRYNSRTRCSPHDLCRGTLRFRCCPGPTGIRAPAIKVISRLRKLAPSTHQTACARPAPCRPACAVHGVDLTIAVFTGEMNPSPVSCSHRAYKKQGMPLLA